MRKLLIIFYLISSSVVAQEVNTWHILSEVGYESKPSEENGFQIDSPKFSKRLWTYNGKKVQLKGYLIPLSELGGKNEYMLSSLPFNSCFFCGGAGPETVVEIQTKQQIKFTTKQITMEGILSLNDKDPNHHIYILKNVKLLD